ncbi:MAG: hypothetical protein ACYDH4_10885 [Candidatus Cryosericum sp.]
MSGGELVWCKCRAIQRDDPRRHFKGCPLREDLPVEDSQSIAKEASALQDTLDKFPTEVWLTYAKCEPGEPLKDDGRKVVLGIEQPPPKRVVIALEFSVQGFGFGEVTLIQTPKGVFLDTERMSLERVKKYFAMLLDGAITDWEEDPEKHKLYDEETGRGCAVCPPIGSEP